MDETNDDQTAADDMTAVGEEASRKADRDLVDQIRADAAEAIRPGRGADLQRD